MAEGRARPRPGTVLLVEDDADDELMTLRALRRAEVAGPVVVVRDGHDALDYFFATGAHVGRDPHRVPVVTLLDIKLPGIDGLEVLRRVRADARTRLAPVVMLSNSEEVRDVAESYGRGANAFVRKPLDPNDLAAAIEVLGAFWLGVNRPPPTPRPT